MYDPNEIPDTVRIVADKVPGNEKGYVVVNKSDFDEKQHKIYQEPVETAKK